QRKLDVRDHRLLIRRLGDGEHGERKTGLEDAGFRDDLQIDRAAGDRDEVAGRLFGGRCLLADGDVEADLTETARVGRPGDVTHRRDLEAGLASDWRRDSSVL